MDKTRLSTDTRIDYHRLQCTMRARHLCASTHQTKRDFFEMIKAERFNVMEAERDCIPIVVSTTGSLWMFASNARLPSSIENPGLT